MTFLKQSIESVAWVGSVLRHLFRFRPVLSGIVVLNVLVGRVARILAFVLPLKVILLAGSNGVPGYFRAYVSAEDKMLAVGLLAGVAIACYFLNLACEAFGRRLGERGGDALMAASAGLSVINNQRGELRSFYSRFTYVAAITVFVMLGMVAMLALNPLITAVLAAASLAGLVATAAILRERGHHARTGLAAYVVDHPSNFVGILSSLSFLCGFLAVLYPLARGGRVDILHSMFAFVLMRHLLSGASTVVKEIVGLSQVRPYVNALLFTEHRLERETNSEQGGLQQLFDKAGRQAKFKAAMVDLVGPDCAVDMRWEDSNVRGAHCFKVAVSAPEATAPARHFEQHVFYFRITRPLENETLLFQHVDRADVFAPPLAARYSYGHFECAVYEAGSGEPPPAASIKALQKEFQMRMAGLQVPKALIDAFKASRPLLSEQLNAKALSRLEIAVETPAERETLTRFRRHLPEIQATLGLVPLRLVNPEFRLSNLTATETSFQVMSWGHWTLEPLGATTAADAETAEEILAHARANRSDVPSSLTPEHLLFAGQCLRLDSAIVRGSFRAAFEMLDEILAALAAMKPMAMRLSA